MEDFDLKETCKKITEYFNSLTDEQFKTEVLCLNGTMNEDTFNKVISLVNIEKAISCGSDCFDFPHGVNESSNCSYQDAIDVINYIKRFVDKDKVKVTDVSKMFYATQIFFMYNSNHYILDTISGQGTIETLILDETEEYKKYIDSVVDITIDPTIEFYKEKK